MHRIPQERSSQADLTTTTYNSNLAPQLRRQMILVRVCRLLSGVKVHIKLLFWDNAVSVHGFRNKQNVSAKSRKLPPSF